jgi:hypothetical protein
VSESTYTESYLAEKAVQNDQDLEIHDIIGGEDVEGMVRYWVDWNPTLVPLHSLGKARELVEKFEARRRAHRRPKNRARISPIRT